MQIINLKTGATGTMPQAPLSLALGTFDGVHLGHIALLCECANAPLGSTTAVFTFSSNPFGVPYILPLDSKLELFGQYGIEYACVCDFEEIRNMPHTSFEDDVLFGTLRASKIVCGFDFCYGQNAKGNTDTLLASCQEHGATLKVIDPIKLDGEKVSSSRIRSLLSEGKITEANKLLTRPFAMVGEVVEGNKLGRTMGFATANIVIPSDAVPLRRGVYASKCMGHVAMTNIGYKPTVGSDILLCETNIFGYEGNLYGEKISVELYDFVRDEQKYADLEQLKSQLEQDKKTIENYFVN